jgi:hypothetical protein
MIQLHAHSLSVFCEPHLENPTWKYMIGLEGRACGSGLWGYHFWSMKFMHEENESPGYCPLLITPIKLFVHPIFLINDNRFISFQELISSFKFDWLEYSRIPPKQKVSRREKHREIEIIWFASS